MHFASQVPWWLVLAGAAASAGAAVWSYRRTPVPLAAWQRGALMALRAAAIGSVLVLLCRPVVMMPPVSARDIIVPVLVDVSRSMRIADADGQTRIARAETILRQTLLPSLAEPYTPEVFAVGEGLAPLSPGGLQADARKSELGAALAAVRDRYRGRRVAAVVLLSDGGDTSAEEESGPESAGAPVFTVGIGSTSGVRDRAVLGVTAGDPRLDQASIDLRVSVVSHGYGRSPFDLRLLANGRVIESRRIVPAADGSPVDEVFAVSPEPLNPTIFSAQIDRASDEPIGENNRRDVLVSPPGPRRRILLLQGAPGFEHSFLVRALAHDPGLEIDSVVRKGTNETGQPTFFVQAGAGRSTSLTTGFPATREALYAYDAIVIANVEGDFFTRQQLQLVAQFVSDRGGGLLVLGSRSFAERGLIGTPLEEVVPVELDERRGALTSASLGIVASAPHDVVVPTAAGETHPVMRLGRTVDETRKRWASMPPLAATAPLGGPRPGASILAVAGTVDGAIRPVVAVQRYGRGRSMIFGGEASWRWRMMLPAADRSYEFFWRQAVRWLAASAPDAVAVTVPESAEPGDVAWIGVDVSDAAFQPASDAVLAATLKTAGGEAAPVAFRRDGARNGRFQAAVRTETAGLYRLDVNARRGATLLGTATRWFDVGGGNREFADPRLNEEFLRRASRASGGRYVRAAEASRLVSWIEEAVPQNAAPERRDLWHEPWVFALVIALLAAEWIVRRRWGLR